MTYEVDFNHRTGTFWQTYGVEDNEERADELAPLIRNLQIGDATNEDFLRTLGVNNFDICVVGVGESFQTALEITVLLKDLGAKYVVARATRDIYKKLLLRNGADHVVYAEREVAERLAVRYDTSSSVFDYVELTPEYGIYEIALPQGWAGYSIIEKNVRSEYNINILAIKRGKNLFPMPHPDYVFQSGETLMVMGGEKEIRRLLQ